jgi:anti-sigma B factor antagonist
MKTGGFFAVDVARRDGAIHVVLEGELDVASLPRLEAALPDPAAGELLVIDLRALEFMDSSGIHVLMALDVASREQGWSLAVVRGPRDVQRVLELCHVPERVRMVDTPGEAGLASG